MEVFTSTPELQNAFLSQEPPLLSVMLFPLFDNNRFWGFIGFDECTYERVWEKGEIAMLRTASEMIGNTMRRWQIAAQLRETLDQLEIRVKERTEELIQSNLQLNDEIQQRKLVQSDLEARLKVEEVLADISTRLLKPTNIRENIGASLADLGSIMDAERIFLAELDVNSPYRLINYQEWTLPNIPAMPEDIVQNYAQLFSGYQEPLRQGKTIVIEDTTHLFPNQDTVNHSLQARRIESVVLSPLNIDQRVHGVLGCSNLLASPETIPLNIRILELVAGMMKSLMQREYLIQSLEERIAERTHQLTTFLDMGMLGNQERDLTELLQPTLVSITQIAACDAASIHIISETSRNLELVAQRGIPQQFLQSLHGIPVNDQFAGWLSIMDPHQSLGDNAEGPVIPDPFCIPGFFAFHANRISTGNKPFGLLSCYRIEDHPFSPFQITLLNALGELIGIIVENYRLRLEAKEFAAVEERQRLAREIHDAVSQSVYSLSLFARSAMDATDEGNRDKLLSNLKDIEVTSLQAMREMRLLLYQLREVGKDEDIGAALDARFKQVENRLGIKGTFDIEEDLFLPENIRHEVWRIIVEALNNTVKHANATHVHVRLACKGEHIQFSVADDGVGFNTEVQSPGMGIKNIRSRAESLKAQLEIFSRPGEGTRIELGIPMTCLDVEEEA